MIVAVLHDVIEDTPVTADDLRQAGFSDKVLAALLCVTHRKDEPYADHVVRCKGDEIARYCWGPSLPSSSSSCPRSGLP
jgi:(p)ppGpp synthase/HD superfamily hydrolase